MKDEKIAFFSFGESSSKQGYIGAILVTDLKGIPLEFKCTQSVRPTSIQRALYGEKLEFYVSINLCALPLLANLTNKPDLIILESRSLITVRKDTNVPVVYASKLVSQILPDQGGINEIRSKKGNSLFFDYNRQFPDDEKSSTEILRNAMEYFDPTEPFQRISNSLHILSQSDAKFA
jgi:hypothetical protein